MYKILLILITVLFFQSSAFARLSGKQEEKLNALIEFSKPNIPLLEKVNEPIKGNVSLFQFVPEENNLKNFYNPAKLPQTISLAPKSTNENAITELEAKRKDLQALEEKGLNFIQPSIYLTEEEQRSIDDFFSRNEQEQLLTLWKATVERNKTIQFIIQKLTPLDSPQAANSLLSRTLGAAIFLPFYAIQAFTNNAGAYVGSQVGGRVLGSVIEGKMQKNQAQMQLSQTESIILFMMIDEVAERLRQRYHAYKRLMVERSLAASELEEAKKDTLDALESKSGGAALIATIQRRSVERDVRRLDAQVRAQKSALIELSGLQAVDELDEQLKIELAATQNTPLDF